MKKRITLSVNGREYSVDVDTTWTLVEVLRDKIGLTGTKHGCGVGACGSCTVNIDGQAINSCLMLAVKAEGKSITTIEGIADGNGLHPIQQAFADNHGMACGYCTPGMIMASKALLDKKLEASEEEIKEALVGHICRCGTYPNIIKSVISAERILKGSSVLK